jgi:hypothetical protein
MQAQGLTVERDHGGAAHLRLPIPRESVVTLPALLSVSLREWVLLRDDTFLQVCEHEFEVVGWDDDPPAGLIVRHLCCPGMGE